jgi:hypothetical protein
MGRVPSRFAQTLLAAAMLHACARPAPQNPGVLSRPPVIPASDSTWARLAHACPNDAPTRLAPPRPAPAPGQFRTQDDRAAELARRVPGGYGGLYVEYDPPLQPDGAIRFETRRAVVFLVDTTQRDTALRALSSELNVVGARTRSARWTFAELYDWYGFLLARGVRDGVVTTDIDEKENRIVFGVESAFGREQLERQLAPLDLPCFLVGVRVPGPRVPG